MRVERDWMRKLVFESPEDPTSQQPPHRRERTRRFTQDSPILPEVWLSGGVAFCRAPDVRVDLLLTPHKDSTASDLAAHLRRRLSTLARPSGSQLVHPTYGPLGGSDDSPLARPTWTVAASQTAVAASMTFKELIGCVLPLSPWWYRNVLEPRSPRNSRPPESEQEKRAAEAKQKQRDVEVAWLARLVGVVALCSEHPTGPQARRLATDDDPWVTTQIDRGSEGATVADYREFCRVVEDRTAQWRRFAEWRAEAEEWDWPGEQVWAIGLNRQSLAAIYKSVPATKSDAALRVFDISCRDLGWAVVDSGIDAQHRAFLPDPKSDSTYPSRVVRSYDFTRLRQILSLDSHPTTGPSARGAEADLEEVDRRAKELRERLRSGRSLEWAQVEPLIDISYGSPNGAYTTPENDHGTHVAGIIGASEPGNYSGVCPDISLYDLRVLDGAGRGEEFSVIAALQFIRYLNARADQPVIHGVNLSLSLLHDVENFACGRSPICEECERLVASGVVVVVAAGNRGYERVLTAGGEIEAYRSISITDPGNAESVITVGATHRFQPHTYGVSYFSSRGPTGDGRIKPDLLGPGERVYSSVPGDQYAAKDGTSMAAPHVSGVAALLMARHREFLGHPARVKKILVGTATDLGRERYFQGSGMVDALRALQSV
jgi:serine protease AprX